jgi:hypothetical protein
MSDMEMYRQLERAKPDRCLEASFRFAPEGIIDRLMSLSISDPLSSCPEQTVRHRTDTSRACHRLLPILRCQNR